MEYTVKYEGDFKDLNLRQEGNINNFKVGEAFMWKNLSDLTGCTGLEGRMDYKFENHGLGYFKLGWDYKHSKKGMNLHDKLMYNFTKKQLEFEGTWSCCDHFLIGNAWILDHVNKKWNLCELGAWYKKDNTTLGLKHTIKGAGLTECKLGNITVMARQDNGANIFGAQVDYNHEKKATKAFLGASRKFNDKTSGKFKVDSEAELNAVLKHQLSKSLTFSMATTMDIHSFAFKDNKPAPFNLTFDFKC